MGTRWSRLGKAVLTSTHNLCFGSKIKKIGIPLYYIKVGYKRVYITRTCYRDTNDKPDITIAVGHGRQASNQRK